MSPNRRTLLRALGGLGAGVLIAGCQSGDDEPDGTPTATSTPTRTAPATPTGTPPAGSTATPSESERAAMRERVRTFLQLFVDASFQQAHERLEPAAAEQITAERLGAIWSQLQETKGRFVGIDSIEYQGRQQQYEVFLAQLQFHNGRQRAVVALGDEAVAGLQFPPGEDWQPPSYADKSAFTEEELSLAATDLLEDGAFVSGWAATATVEGNSATDLWLPGETLSIELDRTTGPDRVKLVTPSSVADSTTVTQL